MALSYFSNWDSMHHFDFSDMNMFPKEEAVHHEEEEENLLTFSDVSDIEHLFNTDDFFLTDDLNSLLSDFSPPPPLPQQPPPPPPPPPPASSQLSTQIIKPFCLQQKYQEPNPKRHKPCNYHDNDHVINYYGSNPNLFNDPFDPINNSFLDPAFQPEYHLPLWENSNNNMNVIPKQTPPKLDDFPSGPPVYSYGSGSHCEMNAKKETSVSSQSIAARNRRRKITEKTQELGKLVPGGQRMNTAEMLQSAYKYIKFLQAQVGILEFMGSSYDNHHLQGNEGLLNCLLTSTLIHEKLYSAEKCLVPQTYVEELSKNDEFVRSNHELVRKVKVE